MTFFAKFCIPFIVGAVVMFAIVLIKYFSWLRNLPKSDLKLIAKGIFTPRTLAAYHIEPWEQNITTLVDFGSKWKDMVPEGTPIPTPIKTDKEEIFTSVGVYEGAGYTLKGIYRPVTECRMKINEAPAFCPVCQRALERLIKFYTEE